MPSSLANKAYLVTGGFSGIGLATVNKLRSEGAIVHAIDLSKSPPAHLVSDKSVYTYPGVDVSSREQVIALFKSILQVTPEIYGLVNSAGICPVSSGVIEPDDTFKAVLNVNVIGTWNTCTEFFQEALRRQKEGLPKLNTSVVNIGSTASLKGFSTLTAYVASKHAVLGLTRSWALDFVDAGVRVNLVAPGGTKTPMAMAQVEDKGVRGEASRSKPVNPQNRFGEPEEQAEAIVFLLSDAASFITGQALPVNGGEMF
ncbi:hypothetical protein H2204_002591 [Knufia peltigerae]|uniref:NAD(P)-binding protein n=1 Tax=Knufia peltigerae TaxID=1002370 RepID=A0AA38YBG6_9EURO|nr:hypothetical protein H2204_002591 [Knufia peltigerae]